MLTFKEKLKYILVIFSINVYSQTKLDSAYDEINKWLESYPNIGKIGKAHLDQSDKLPGQINFSSEFKHLNWPSTAFSVLDTYLEKSSDEQENETIRFLIKDLLLFSVILPSEARNLGSNKIKLNSIQAMTPYQASVLIEKMAYRSKNFPDFELKTMDEFQHINNWDDYKKSNFIFRMMQISLSNLLRPSDRIGETGEGICAPLKDLPIEQQLKWSLSSCSSAQRQQYMNSCTTSSIIQNILAHVFTPFPLLPILERSLKFVEDKVLKSDFLSKDLRKNKKYIASELNYIKENQRILETDLRSYLKSSQPDDQKISSLTYRWSGLMQRLSMLMDDSNLAVPTGRPFEGSGLLSGAIMALPALMESAFSKRPLLARANGVYYKSVYRALLTSVNISAINHSVDLREYNQLDEKINLENVENFWRELVEHGGVVMGVSGVVGHAIYIRPFIKGHRKYFLKGDPSNSHYEILSLDDFVKFAKEAKAELEILL